MKKLALFLVLVLAAFLIWFKTTYGGAVVPFPDRSTPPLLSASAVEIVAELPEAPGNVAVSAEGRVFFNFHPEGRPALKVVEWVNGKAVPFPPSFDPYVAPYSLRIDRKNRLWTLDWAFHGAREVRLLTFDLATKQLVHRWDLPRDVAGLGSYVQDFQVSPDGKHVFLADAGVASRRPALIVYDVEKNLGRRVLERDRSVLDHPFLIDAKGTRMILLGGFFAMHPALDSIGLDAEGEWLYYGPMSGERLFRVRTRDLLDETLSPAALSARVEDYGPKVQSDGISLDTAGSVYLTDVEHGAVSILNPDRELRTLVRDPRWRWPDGLSFGPEDWLYVTDSAIPDLLLKSREHMRKAAPYFIWRFRTGIPGIPGR
ncbi:MAG TPA: L-dopachrome tautomerase-related protein [Thermoanaerobaculia bacterium]|nr:L-dopachrome tautomerase-related protein [Thermoanaerobaculia bacterium]HQR67482.1 L-dopachrome tautomerase-related protein [Thermoanaerobaculia bacterium]